MQIGGEKMEANSYPQGESFARIKVIGVGGGGCNAGNRMITEGMQGIEFIAVNKGWTGVGLFQAATRVRIGESHSRRGAGGDTRNVARQTKNLDDLYQVLKAAIWFRDCRYGGRLAPWCGAHHRPDCKEWMH
jgi:cell division protein FtsZ